MISPLGSSVLLLGMPWKFFLIDSFKSRRPRWAGHVARMEEGRSAFKILTRSPIGRHGRRSEDSIRMYLK